MMAESIKVSDSRPGIARSAFLLSLPGIALGNPSRCDADLHVSSPDATRLYHDLKVRDVGRGDRCGFVKPVGDFVVPRIGEKDARTRTKYVTISQFKVPILSQTVDGITDRLDVGVCQHETYPVSQVLSANIQRLCHVLTVLVIIRCVNGGQTAIVSRGLTSKRPSRFWRGGLR